MTARRDPAVADFAPALIAWQKCHGRHDLPWQQTRDPYAVWLSEIMLQQTQVTAVIPYYQRFLERFPTIAALAAAPADDVLALWSGLGYYSRARNLHRAAQIMVAEHGGRFPQMLDAVMALPGIGRSTAAAILVFAFGKRGAILDGNVKRVLARARGVAGYPGESAVAENGAARLHPGFDGSRRHRVCATQAALFGVSGADALCGTQNGPYCRTADAEAAQGFAAATDADADTAARG